MRANSHTSGDSRILNVISATAKHYQMDDAYILLPRSFCLSCTTQLPFCLGGRSPRPSRRRQEVCRRRLGSAPIKWTLCQRPKARLSGSKCWNGRRTKHRALSGSAQFKVPRGSARSVSLSSRTARTTVACASGACLRWTTTVRG